MHLISTYLLKTHRKWGTGSVKSARPIIHLKIQSARFAYPQILIYKPRVHQIINQCSSRLKFNQCRSLLTNCLNLLKLSLKLLKFLNLLNLCLNLLKTFLHLEQIQERQPMLQRLGLLDSNLLKWQHHKPINQFLHLDQILEHQPMSHQLGLRMDQILGEFPMF